MRGVGSMRLGEVPFGLEGVGDVQEEGRDREG